MVASTERKLATFGFILFYGNKNFMLILVHVCIFGEEEQSGGN